jgi:hypothetical protein
VCVKNTARRRIENAGSDAELERLSVARAGAIRGYMVEMAKIPAERMEIIEPAVSDERGEWVKCKLALEASD